MAQAGHRLVGAGEPLDEAALEPVTGIVPPSAITGFLKAAATGSYDALQDAVDVGHPSLL